MPSFAKLPPRSFVAFRHADRSDLGAFYYSIALGAWGVPSGLSLRAVRYLAAFGVLVRSGEHGFRGVRAPVWALADFVGRVTAGASSPTTTRRALRELEAGGWIQIGHYGGGEPRELLNAAGDPYWIRDQVPVVTFEVKLWRLFQRSGRPDPAAAVVACAPSDYGYQSGGVTNSDLEPVSSKQVSPRAPEGDRSSVADPGCSIEEPGPASGPGALDCGETSPPIAAGSVPLPASRRALRGSKSKTRAKSRGGRVPPEVRAARPYRRREAARALLEVLARVAEKHGRPGRAAVARAALELSDPCAADCSLVAWDYWLARWAELSASERCSVLRREVLPALLECGGSVVVGLPSSTGCGDEEPSVARCFEEVPGPDLEASMVEAARGGSPFAENWLKARGLSW